MEINTTNNISFNGLWAKISTGKIAKANKALLQKAENRLQERLVDFRTVMRDFDTGLYLNMQDGKKFTGKFSIQADKFEHICHIKDGKPVGELVRCKNGEKVWASIIRKGKKSFNKTFKTSLPHNEEKKQAIKMCDADMLAHEQISDNFVIKQAMQSDSDYIYLTK